MADIQEINKSLSPYGFQVNDIIQIEHDVDPDGIEAEDKLDMRLYSDGTLGIIVTGGLEGESSSGVFSYKEFVPHLEALEDLVEEVKKAKLNGE